jgi:type IX secretion system PorP/SprF family membrane protein
MKINKHLLLLFVATVLSRPESARAQDVHFTQFDMVSPNTNPAQTGSFEGTYRFSALYRSQWNQITNGYQTPLAGVDFNINGFRKGDWIGIGAQAYMDRAGVGLLTNTLLGLTGAYHMALDKKRATVLSIGARVGFLQRRIDETKLISEEFIRNNGRSNLDILGINEGGKSYTDLSAGVSLTNTSKSGLLNAGLSIDHLNAPTYNLVTTISKLPQRINLHASYGANVGKKWIVTPSFLFRTIAGVNETMVQGTLGYKFDPKRNIILRGGVGTRFGDAIHILAGADWGSFRVGGAYDLTTSGLRNASVYDAFEVGLSYVGKIYKKPTIKPVILCPRF